MKKTSFGAVKKKPNIKGVVIAKTKICKRCLASFVPDDNEDICIVCIYEERK